MQSLLKNSKKSFYKNDKRKSIIDQESKIKFQILQRFVCETKIFKNEIKQTIKVVHDYFFKDLD